MNTSPVSPIHANVTKAGLRHECITRRTRVDSQQAILWGEQLVEQAQKIDALAHAKTVAAYVSMGTELPTRPLLSWLLGRGVSVLVPRLGTGKQIGWSYLPQSTHLDSCLGKAGEHRPDEPVTSPVLGLSALGSADVILTPAFLVDSEGYRLGRGAGWYDQALLHRNADALIVAVVYPWEDQPQASLPREDHDIAVNMVMTPTSMRTLRSEK